MRGLPEATARAMLINLPPAAAQQPPAASGQAGVAPAAVTSMFPAALMGSGIGRPRTRIFSSHGAPTRTHSGPLVKWRVWPALERAQEDQPARGRAGPHLEP